MTINRDRLNVVAPDPEPVAGLETDQMGQGILENRVLDIFREIATSGQAGGPALVRLAADLETMIHSASFPRLVATITADPDDEEPDDFGNPATIVTLSCPVCGDSDVDPGEVYAVDTATRWTATEIFEATFDPAPGGYVRFVRVRYGHPEDFEGVGYYLHASERSGYKAHPVSLPERWKKAAL